MSDGPEAFNLSLTEREWLVVGTAIEDYRKNVVDEQTLMGHVSHVNFQREINALDRVKQKMIDQLLPMST